MYLWNDPSATIVEAARTVNKSMPAVTVKALENLHGNLSGQTVVVLGAAYRGGVKETAFSGVFDTVQELIDRGARVKVQDPLYSDDELNSIGFNAWHFGEKTDAAIIQTNHAEYSSLTSDSFPQIRTVVDGRNILNPENFIGINFLILGKAK